MSLGKIGGNLPKRKGEGVGETPKTSPSERESAEAGKGVEFELSEEDRKAIGEILEKEIEERKKRFLVEWFDTHKTELGFPKSAEISKDAKIQHATAAGALGELERKMEYAETKEEIDNLKLLREALQKGKVSIRAQQALLYYLNKRYSALKERYSDEKAKESPDKEKLDKLQEELDKLFELRKKLANNVTGRNLEREAKEKVEKSQQEINDKKDAQKKERKRAIFEAKWKELSDEEKKKYSNDIQQFINTKIEEYKTKIQEIAQVEVEVDEDTILALLDAGYNPDEFRKKKFQTVLSPYPPSSLPSFAILEQVEVKKGERIFLKEFQTFIDRKKENFLQRIDKEARRILVREKIDSEIEKTLPQEKEPITKTCQTIKEELEKKPDETKPEEKKPEEKEEPKKLPPEKIKEIETKLRKKGIEDPFIEILLLDLSGDVNQDVERLGDFLEDYEFQIDRERLKQIIGDPEKLKQLIGSPEEYGEKVKERDNNPRDFYNFILGVIGKLIEETQS